MDSTDLMQAGDCLLYEPASIFGLAIAIKTWHHISHVEVCVGTQLGIPFSYASRDGQGVNLYPTRTTQLAYILRPTVSFDLAAGLRYARRMVGTPYGWWDLLNFVGVNVDTHGIVCSSFATEFYRACGWKLFPTDDACDIAPFEFLNLVDNGFVIVPLDGSGTKVNAIS